MGKIVALSQAIKISRYLRSRGQKVILVGGCFDIIHPGHIKFLQKAKNTGDVLFLALEPDVTVKRLKGKGRPVFRQKERAQVLAELRTVDYIILLPELIGDADYFNFSRQLSPKVFAVTFGDPQLKNKKLQAKEVGGKVAVVMRPIRTNSTSKIISVLEKEL